MTSLLCLEQYTELRSGESLRGNGCSMRKNVGQQLNKSAPGTALTVFPEGLTLGWEG